MENNTLHLLILTLALTLLLRCARRLLRTPKHIYLLDFACHKPSDSDRAPTATCLEHYALYDGLAPASVTFLTKILERSGIGPESCVPDATHALPPDESLRAARAEIESVLFDAVADLFERTRSVADPRDVAVIVSNCSLTCPTPSIAAMVANRFKMGSDVRCYSLAGMGCSAGLLAVDLAREVLGGMKGEGLALVLSMEGIAGNGYTGGTKSMLLTNCLFRMGGAAERDRSASKYVLRRLVRTHLGSQDRAYSCVFHEPDKEGFVGISLSRDILSVAGDALRANIATLGPSILPYLEQFKYAWSIIRRKILQSPTTAYVPDFKKVVEHFCIHAGGRAVIDAIEERLDLSEADVEASKMTLYRFGNTSSSSVWYELCYLEAKGRVRRGDRVWQIGFGSGFKCNSAIWECVSDLEPRPRNAWSDRIHLYPVQVPDMLYH
ncbi:3-ketoacyl-CoA synthase 6 [Acorus calamus]|uniref:3-ketoacyl-CoA synthase n=1 Tax=Acorus calamus TaxID=4465 RepID=A0AAV9D2U7_ACOCL|nr:3-ketoacyl-CoA synthase 6 [Acorus calamus]